MRHPQPQLDSLCFSLQTPGELIRALGDECSHDEVGEIHRLCEYGLPPVTSADALAVMLGYNPGFVWSLLNRTPRYYRRFSIPKGKKERQIDAPRVALKAIQTWLNGHFQRAWTTGDNVFGFVPGRSHIDAARRHRQAKWVYSVDIEDFFPSVSAQRVQDALRALGYQAEQSILILSSLCCLKGRLVQGAPTSPTLSNIVLSGLDEKLSMIAREEGLAFTRYADDIVFSGRLDVPDGVLARINDAVVSDGWKLAARKVTLSKSPARLKVHGLLVHGEKVRLTKGYRNRIRAYRHLLGRGKISSTDLSRVRGHLNYADQIEKAD